MFKFFRKHNSWLLAVGVTLLMIVFLIQGTLDMFHRDPGKEPIGTINGSAVTLNDQRGAAEELRALEAVAPLFTRFTTQDPTQWLLMLREAQGLGISASDYEVDQLLQAIGLGDKERFPQIARQLHVSAATLREVFRHWVIIQSYREVILGLAHVNLQDRLTLYSQAGQFAQAGFVPGAIMMLQSSQGALRTSEPLVARFLQDQEATVRIVAVPVPSSRYLSKVEATALDEKELQELFEQYKDKLPGKSEPYGLGYRTPDRVKIEYLAFPFERLAAKVDVEEADVLEYYDTHRNDFRPEPASQPATQPAVAPAAPENPTPEARGKIIVLLRQRKASELGEKLVKAAQAMLAQGTSGLPETAEGYKVLEPAWRPPPLATVAEKLQQEYGFLPDLQSYNDRWLDRDELAKLPNLSQALLPLDQRRAASVVDYIFSAKEIKPKSDNPLVGRRLQVGVNSQTLIDRTGSRYIFRLTAAEPARSPASLDEVRDQVARDARQLKAFELLIKDRDQWAARLAKQSAESLAAELGTKLLNPPAFPRREVGPNLELIVPEIEGVGRNPAFVDRVFALARNVADAGGVVKASSAQRTEAIPVDARMSLYVVRIQDYKPLGRADFEQKAGSPQVATWIYDSMMADSSDNPFTTDNIAKRVGYVPRAGQKTEKPATKSE